MTTRTKKAATVTIPAPNGPTTRRTPGRAEPAHTRAVFSVWLRRQADRPDAVGDLARDFAEGARSGTHGRRFTTPRGFRRTLHRMGACPGAFRALDHAASEWQAIA